MGLGVCCGYIVGEAVGCGGWFGFCVIFVEVFFNLFFVVFFVDLDVGFVWVGGLVVCSFVFLLFGLLLFLCFCFYGRGYGWGGGGGGGIII